MNPKPYTKAVELFKRAQENARLQKLKKNIYPAQQEPRENISPQRVY